MPENSDLVQLIWIFGICSMSSSSIQYRTNKRSLSQHISPTSFFVRTLSNHGKIKLGENCLVCQGKISQKQEAKLRIPRPLPEEENEN